MGEMVPDGYPFAMNDEALQAALAEMLETTRSVYGGVSFGRALPELKLAIVMVGVQERSRRETESLRASTEQAAAAASRAAKYALGVSILALVVASFGIVVSVIAAFAD
jgi:hypothetical protein